MDTLSKLFEELVEICERYGMDNVDEFNGNVSLIREILQIKQQEIDRLVEILSNSEENSMLDRPTAKQMFMSGWRKQQHPS